MLELDAACGQLLEALGGDRRGLSFRDLAYIEEPSVPSPDSRPGRKGVPSPGQLSPNEADKLLKIKRNGSKTNLKRS